MITITIVREIKLKGGKQSYERKLQCFKSMDVARKEISPIVREMKQAEKDKRIPKCRIEAVSWDTPSEKSLIIELDAIKQENLKNEPF